MRRALLFLAVLRVGGAGRNALDEIRDDFETRARDLLSDLRRIEDIEFQTVSLTAFEGEHSGEQALPFSYRDRFGTLYVCDSEDDEGNEDVESTKMPRDGFVRWGSAKEDSAQQNPEKEVPKKETRDKKVASGRSTKKSSSTASGANEKIATRPNWHDQLVGHCSTFREGWWTFEWCHKQQIMQYHTDTATGKRDPTWS